MAVAKDSQPHVNTTSPQQQEEQTKEHHTSNYPLFTSGMTSSSHDGSAVVGHESALKMYYISLEFANQESNDTAIIRWTLPDDFKNRDSEKEIPGMTVVTNEFVFGAVGVPAPIMFEAREKFTGRAVKLNGKSVLNVTPSLAKNTIKVQVTVPEGSYFFVHFLFFSVKSLKQIVLYNVKELIHDDNCLSSFKGFFLIVCTSYQTIPSSQPF